MYIIGKPLYACEVLHVVVECCVGTWYICAGAYGYGYLIIIMVPNNGLVQSNNSVVHLLFVFDDEENTTQ